MERYHNRNIFEDESSVVYMLISCQHLPHATTVQSLYCIDVKRM